MTILLCPTWNGTKGGTLTIRNDVMRLFIYCSDPREEADLETKINKTLLTPGEKIHRIAVYGGPIFLAHPIIFCDEANTMLRQIDFAISEFHPEETVIVGHNCAFYKTKPSLATIGIHDKKQDISKIWKMLMRRHPNQTFKSFFDISQGEQVQFEHFAA